MFLEVVLALFTIYIVNRFYREYIKKKNKPKGSRNVPKVAGSLPFVGHGIAFSRDIIGFVRKCRQKYGPVFSIDIFRKEMVIVCDHKMKPEFFSAKEDKYSLYDALSSLYFDDAFTDDPAWITQIITIVKKSVTTKFDKFAPKIMEEAKRLIERIRERSDDGAFNLSDEMIRFVASTSAKCFVGIEIDDEFYETLIKFTKLLNKIVVLTYFFPKWLIKFALDRYLRPYRKKMVKMLIPTIKKYQEDKTLNESLIIRKAIDSINEITNEPLTPEHVGDIIVCLLYVSSENTALGLTSTIRDLLRDKKYWNMVRDSSFKHLANDDVRSLFSDQKILACIFESARINTHIFALNRVPKNKKSVIGGYYVGYADVVAMCEPMMMMYDDAQFTEAEKYNPDRFLGDNPESKVAYSVMTWGAGVHLCPGKMFALYEIVAACAMLTTNFKKLKFAGDEPEKDYFSPSAFAETKVQIEAKPLSKDDIKTQLEKLREVTKVEHNDKTYLVEHVKTNQGSGWLIKDYLTIDEQKEYYNYTIKLSEGSDEHEEIKKLSCAYPISYENLVYTKTSNCNSSPTKWYRMADEVWKLLKNNSDELSFPKDMSKPEFNSMYAQLYSYDSKMSVHKDKYIDWGFSVSLGASCNFTFANKTLVLNSGDVFVADFSKVDHSVEKIHDDTIPGWFSEDDNVKTFGKARCSVQIRDITGKYPTELMDISEFKNMLKKSN